MTRELRIDAYRTPAILEPVSVLPPACRACPECGATMLVCPNNSDHLYHETDRLREGSWCDECRSYNGGSKYHRLKRNPAVYLGPLTICGPNRRVRHGFLWLRKCDEPDMHAHQSCGRCGWVGVAKPPDTEPRP